MTRHFHQRLFYLLTIGMSAFLIAGCGSSRPQDSKLPLTTPYQAVFLDNGQFFYGKVDQSLSGFLLLTDIYYIQGSQDPETKQVKNILIQRGKEWHSPDRMFLNLRHVVAIEPVTSTSEVAQLIEKQQTNREVK
ncbi:hypothetical protein [Ferrovum myxofaciens]|uniref:hypothetical protein n=1 Tax=Ferrovum myxofaciens TaxID=416213 RepID=UPI003EB846B1